MNSGWKEFLLFTCLGISYGVLTYYCLGGWWHSSIGTVLIVFFSSCIWKKDAVGQMGLRITPEAAGLSVLTAILVVACSLLFIQSIARKNGIQIYFTNWRNYYHDVFYTLNEEIVLGALLLFSLTKKWKVSPLSASLGIAVLFSLVHFVFYQWIMRERGTLQVFTLLTLFLVGFIRNNLILRTGHIGFSWALHVGWIAVMFGSNHVYSIGQTRVIEPERFNLYLGHPAVTAVCFLLATISLMEWIQHARKQIK